MKKTLIFDNNEAAKVFFRTSNFLGLQSLPEQELILTTMLKLFRGLNVIFCSARKDQKIFFAAVAL